MQRLCCSVPWLYLALFKLLKTGIKTMISQDFLKLYSSYSDAKHDLKTLSIYSKTFGRDNIVAYKFEDDSEVQCDLRSGDWWAI